MQKSFYPCLDRDLASKFLLMKQETLVALVSCYNKCQFLDEGEKSVYYYYLPATTPTTTTTKATTTTSTTTSSPNRHRGLNGSKVALVKN